MIVGVFDNKIKLSVKLNVCSQFWSHQNDKFRIENNVNYWLYAKVNLIHGCSEGRKILSQEKAVRVEKYYVKKK